MPEPMPLHEATAVLRGRRITGPGDRDRAAGLVLAALDQRHVVTVWADRLLAALDDGDTDATDRARRRLREALDGLRR